MYRSANQISVRFVAGWTLLLVWFGAFSGLAPGLFSALARLEGSHEVELSGAGGTVSVILTHGSSNAGRAHAQIHRHCLLARALTAISEPASGKPDHVVKFTSASNSTTEERLMVPEPPLLAEVVAPEFVAGEEILFPHVAVALSWPHGAPPGYFFRPGLVGLRSTLLLI